MRILQANKFFFPEYGTEKYLFDLMAALESHGHEVVHFAMEHPKNHPSKFSQHFVPNVDYAGLSFGWRALQRIGRMIYSFEAREKFAALLDETKPDLVHVHSIHHQISPSILLEAKRRGIPIVQTLHDHKLVAPSYHFPLRDGRVCTDCRRGRWLHLLGHRAHKNSLTATAAVVLESGIHALTRVYERTVERFIVPSRDMASRLVEMGVDPKQLTVVPHHVDLATWTPSTSAGRGILFAGRLAPERGLDHVVEAAAALPSETFYVAGDGPERAALEAKLAVRGVQNVQLLGHVEGVQLRQLFRSVRAVLYPTQTLETFGLTVLEAMASGKPVIASKLGAVQDLVRDGETGFLYDANRPDQAVDAIKKLLVNDALAERMGRAARTDAEAYSLDANYQAIVGIYNDVLAARERRTVAQAFVTAPA